MKSKGFWIFWTDVLNALLITALAATGIILRWGLPHGSGGGAGGGGGPGAGMGWRGGRGPRIAAEWLGLNRHEWGDVHLWIAITLAAGIIVHLLLHTGWIVAACRRWLWPARKGQPLGQT